MTTQQNELKASILITLSEGKPWPDFEGGQLARLNRERHAIDKATAPTLAPTPTPSNQKPPPASEASS